jgi:CHAT domain
MVGLSYFSCTVTVHNEHQLTFRSDYAEDLDNVEFGRDPLTLASIKRLSSWVEAGQHCRREDLELLGKHLYRYMFGDENNTVHKRFFAALNHAKSQKADFRLRLTLAFERNAVDLASFPWEFLYVDHDGGFFFSAPSKSHQLVLTRFVPPPAELVESIEPDDRPLRILVAVCSPAAEGLAKVSASRLLPVLEGLRGAQVDVKVLPNPRYADIEDEIRPKGRPEWWPHIFHFIGHGDVRDGRGMVAIRFSQEDEDSRYAETGKRTPDADWIPAAKLADLFPEKLPRLVFLHACRGAKADSSDRSFASGAEEFVLRGTPAAIAMRYDIGSEDADLFAQHFYQALSSGLPVDDAVSTARVKLAKTTAPNSYGDRKFGVPLLFLQSTGQAILLPPVVQPQDTSDDAEGQPEEPAIFDCPYFQPGSRRRCGRPIDRSMGVCPRCLNVLIWCSNGHPSMADDRICMKCQVSLSEAAPARGLELVGDAGRSGFG